MSVCNFVIYVISCDFVRYWLVLSGLSCDFVGFRVFWGGFRSLPSIVSNRGGRPTAVRSVCAFTHGVPTGQLQPKIGRNKDNQTHVGNIIRNNGNYGHEKGQRGNKYGCDLMLQQRGLIDPKLYTTHRWRSPGGVTFTFVRDLASLDKQRLHFASCMFQRQFLGFKGGKSTVNK